MAYTYAGRYSPDGFTNGYGQPLVNTPVYVYAPGTSTPATLYTDRSKTATTANPFNTDSRGNGSFYADPGFYDLVANGIRVSNILIELDPSEDVAAGALAPDIQTFSASGTWTKPAGNYRLATVLVIGPGGGGGGGRKGAAASSRQAGGGGQAGLYSLITIPLSWCGATETVTVGTGGTGGAGATSNSSDGSNGNNGSANSSFGSLVRAVAGVGGGGGTAAAGAGGTSTMMGTVPETGGSGTASNATLNNGLTIVGGGGAGGLINSSNVANPGLPGNYVPVWTDSIANGGANTGANGGNGTAPPSNSFWGGTGGGGGGANLSGNAGNGGNGVRGSGGGGGGAAVDSVGNAGSGGNGGDGYVLVICT